METREPIVRWRRDRARERSAPQPHDWRVYPSFKAIMAFGGPGNRPRDEGQVLACWDVVVPSRVARRGAPVGYLWIFERVLALPIENNTGLRFGTPPPLAAARRGELRDLRIEQVDHRRWRAALQWPDGSWDNVESDRPHTADFMHLLELWVHDGDLTPYLDVETDD